MDKIQLDILLSISNRPVYGVDYELLEKVFLNRTNIKKPELEYHIKKLIELNFIRQKDGFLFVEQNGIEYLYKTKNKKRRKQSE